MRAEEARVGAALSRVLAPELARIHRTAELLDDVMRVGTASLPETRRAVVAATLTARVCNDLRAMAVVIEHGYMQQANSIAAGLCDSAFRLGVLAGDEAASLEWLNDPSTASTRPSTTKCIERLCRSVPLQPDVDLQIEYFKGNYQGLSSIKHGNGRQLQRLGIDRHEGNSSTVAVGPRLDVHVHSLGQATLFTVTEIVLFCARAYAMAQCPSGAFAERLDDAWHEVLDAGEAWRALYLTDTVG